MVDFVRYLLGFWGISPQNVQVNIGKRDLFFPYILANNIEGGSMDQELLRKKLNDVIASGLVARAISRSTNISTDILSRFKNGHICLCQNDEKILSAYLDKVVIP